MIAMVLAIMLTTSGAAVGDDPKSLTGKDLSARCSADGDTEPGRRDRTFCVDYIYVIANGIDAERRRKRLPQCVPADIDPDRLRRIVAGRLKFERQIKAADPMGFVAMTLLDAFDCNSGKSQSMPMAGGEVFSHRP